ncbi:MAG TPA: transglycosylase domain-containing protein [Thermoleophilaceae bacterium]|nr:transglycosylase domain-containing protein [Thermoleophilaceae bacterium]
MTHRQRQLRKRRNGAARNKALLGLIVIAIALGVGLLSVAGYVLAVTATAPALSELKPIDKGESSVIFAADGTRLGYVQSDEIRTRIPWKDMPVAMRQATVAIEDERFYQHEGVDYGAIVRAGIRNIESGRTVEGGSTITQQLVRALYIEDPKRDFSRKIREAKLASELEEQRSKRWILHNYLNSVPFGTVGGRTAVGIEAAASTFFAKHARDLTLPEAALLAGLPQAPSRYNPFRNPAVALERRNDVIRQMAENGMITQAEAQEASQAPLELRRGTRYTTRREPYFFDYVQEKLIEHYGVGVYRRGGLKVYTTIEPDLQEAARASILAQLPNPWDPTAAIVSIDPSNGYIRAMASSGTYKDRTFNLAAQGHRQPGSAMKTFVLTAAVRNGVDPNSTSYTSKPLNLNTDYGPWEVKTYGNTYGGTMTLHRATLSSDNTVYAQLILDLGPKEVCETAKLMGITTKLDCLPAEGLGGLRLGVSPLEMANAYATLASGGMRNQAKAIKRVVFPDGKSDDLGKPKRKRVFPDGVAAEVTEILKANVDGGTGTNANFGCADIAGKTGTTDNHNDAWFVGYTPKLSTSVWMGHPNALVPMPGMQGGSTPAVIWGNYMGIAIGDDCETFPPPKDPADFSPFYGEYSSTGGSSSYSYDDRDGYSSTPYTAPSDGTSDGTTGGYDPRLYESPPQEAPAPAPPPGGGGGGGGGEAEGSPGGGTPGDD